MQLVYRADDAAPGMPVQSFTIEADGAPAPAVLRAVELMPSDYPCYESADEHYITKEPGLFPDPAGPAGGAPRLHRCRASTAACG